MDPEDCVYCFQWLVLYLLSFHDSKGSNSGYVFESQGLSSRAEAPSHHPAFGLLSIQAYSYGQSFGMAQGKNE